MRVRRLEFYFSRFFGEVWLGASTAALISGVDESLHSSRLHIILLLFHL